MQISYQMKIAILIFLFLNIIKLFLYILVFCKFKLSKTNTKNDLINQ